MVRREYNGAQERIDKQYKIKPLMTSADSFLDPAEALDHVLKLLRKSPISDASSGKKRKLALIEKRLARLKSELMEIMDLSPHTKGPPA